MKKFGPALMGIGIFGLIGCMIASSVIAREYAIGGSIVSMIVMVLGYLGICSEDKAIYRRWPGQED